MVKIKVIIADDHPAFREGLSRLLSDESDLEVVGLTADGETAVEWAYKLHPDVVILDISMPKVNGIEAAKLIRQGSPSTRILMLTAYNYPSHVAASLQAGAAGYLSKDTSLYQITDAVRMVYAGEGVFDLKLAGKFFRQLSTSKTGSNENGEELHPRELQVLSLACRGMRNKEIAVQLKIGERTVQTHMLNILRKLHVGSRTEAILYALKQGWISLEDVASVDKTSWQTIKSSNLN